MLTARGEESALPSREALQASLDLAYCDLGRFMSGWGWWGHDLSGKIQQVLQKVDGGRALASEEAYVEAIFAAFPLGG